VSDENRAVTYKTVNVSRLQVLKSSIKI